LINYPSSPGIERRYTSDSGAFFAETGPVLHLSVAAGDD